MKQVNAIYGFAYPNLNMSNVAKVEGDILSFETDEQLEAFMNDNNFVKRELLGMTLIVTNEDDANIYGKIEGEEFTIHGTMGSGYLK